MGVRGGEAQEVPGGAGEAPHGVRLPLRRAPADGAGALHPLRSPGQGRLPGAVRGEVVQVGQGHRQLGFRHQLLPVLGAVDHGDGRAPVALAGDQPVPHAVVDRAPAQALLLHPGADGADPVSPVSGGAGHPGLHPGRVEAPGPPQLLALRCRQLLPVPGGEGAVEGAGVDHLAGPHVGVRQGLPALPPLPPLPPGGGDHHLDRDAVVAGEGEVPRVVGRDAHHHPGAVGAQDVVGHPQLDALPVEGVDGVAPGEDPRLLPLQGEAVDLAGALGPLHVGQHLLPPLGGGQALHQGVLGGQDHEGDPEHGVRAGGKDRQVVRFPVRRGPRPGLGFGPEADLGALAAPDPVGLHQLDRLGPLDLPQPFQQLVGVGGDAEVPGRDLLLGQSAVPSPADPVLGLLVAQGGLAGGAPPLPLGVPVGQAPAVQQLEEPLRPAEVGGIGGVDLPLPVEGDPHQVELALVVGLVAVGGDAGGDAGADSVLLRGLAEGVPAHGVQDVVPPHAQEAAQGVRGDVVLEVPHAESVAGGVGEEVQAVVLGLATPFVAGVEALPLPAPLPARLQGAVVVGRDATRLLRAPGGAGRRLFALDGRH